MGRTRSEASKEKNREWQTHFNHSPEGKAARERYNAKRHPYRVCIHEETDRDLWEALDQDSEKPIPQQIKELAKEALRLRQMVHDHTWQIYE